MFGRVIVAIGGFIVVVLFAALLAPFVLDWSSFRVEFEQQASRMLGKKVSVHGEVDARILPFPSITLHDVRVGQDVDGKPLAQIASFSMDMELAPFLSGEARIFDMRIEDPTVRVRVLKDGTLDWMRGSRPAIPTRIVVIEDIHVRNASVALIDEQSGRFRNITGLTAEMSAASLAGPWRGDGNAKLDGEEARFSLVTGAADVAAKRLPLRLRLWPEEEPLEVNLDGELALADNVPTYRGSFTANVLQEEDDTEPVSAPPPGPRVKGGFELTNDRIRVADYRLEVGALADPYVVTGEATLDTGSKPEFLLTAEGQQIDVNKFGQQGTHGKTGRDAAASAQRRLNAFVEMAASIPIPQVPGRASLKLPAMILNDTTIRDIQLDVRPADGGWTVDKAIATLPGRTRMEAAGALVLEGSPSFKGNVLFASTQPSGLADWLSGRVDPAIRQLRTAGFSANVDLTTDVQRFDSLELAIGPATLKGSIERQSQGARAPGLSVDLAGDEIDLDAMRALSSLVTGEDAGHSVLDHRLEAKLKAQKFTASGVVAANVDTAFTMAGGVLSLGHLSVGDIAGARVSAEGQVEGSLLDYRGNAKVHLQASDPTAFIAMLQQQLPEHPVLDRLSANAAFYSGANLTADVTIGQGTDGAKAKIAGNINGSTVNANVELPTVFNLTGGDAMTIAVSLANPKSEILLGQAGLDILPFGGDGQGSLVLNIQKKEDGPGRTTLAFKTDRTAFAASGDISLMAQDFGEGQGHIELKSQNLEPYMLLTGVGVPQFGGGLPVDLQADFKLADETIEITSLRGNADGNGIDASLSIDRTSANLKADGALSIDTLDLGWLGDAVFGPLTIAESEKPSNEAFSLPVFGESDVSLDVKAKTFHASEMGRVTDFSTKLVHRGGGISLDDAKGNWQGGKIAGRILISNGNGTGILQTKLHVENADLSSMVWRRGDRPVANGRIGFDVSAEASGSNMRDLAGALSGSGVVELSGLTVYGINPDLLKQMMTSADGIKGEVKDVNFDGQVAALVHQGELALGQVRIPFSISGGGLRVQDVRLPSRGLTFTAEGNASVFERGMSGSIGVTYDAGDEAVAGGDPTVRLRYSGDRTEPRERIDVAALTNFLSMRAYEQERRRVEMLQSSVLEKQRLRREVSLYNFNATERAAEKARMEAEERQRQAMVEAAKAAEEERQRKANELQLTVPPTNENLQPGNQVGRPFGEGNLPGISQ
ncbi:AsmA family protein [Rhizobium wenxiniae]|uniref:AsmA family protein n=1 Tax=Rhizobium wenxiniae TaxID=1737357 RepID=UPI003C139962